MYTVDQSEVTGDARVKLLTTLSTCCMELQIMVVRLEDKSMEKAADVSFRLTTTPPTERPRRRAL